MGTTAFYDPQSGAAKIEHRLWQSSGFAQRTHQWCRIYVATVVTALLLQVDTPAEGQAAEPSPAEGQSAQAQRLDVTSSVPSTPVAPQVPAEGTLSDREQRDRFIWNTFGPPGLIGNGLTTAWRQWQNVPPEWQRTKKGFVERFASEYGESVVDDSTRFLMARYVDEDPSFRRCVCTGFGRRVRHAVAGPFSAYKPDGTQVFSMSSLLGIVVGQTVARTWSPPSDRVHGIAAHVAVDITGKAGVDLLREFRHRASR
jgi:hypothetical protein